MNRLAAATCAALIVLTLVTWSLAHAQAPAWVLATTAFAKVALVGEVFLELRHAAPQWRALFHGTVAVVLGLTTVFVL